YLILKALIALEQRFAQINYAKISDPNSWESIRHAERLSDPAKHLVFETFQFYHQAFLLHKRRAISNADYSEAIREGSFSPRSDSVGSRGFPLIWEGQGPRIPTQSLRGSESQFPG
ncbi:MAG TPA: hypothetical protein VF590_23665, partial [Isosphaeraceae bacterium]